MTSQACDPNNSRQQLARGQGRSPEHPIITLVETKMQKEQEVLQQKHTEHSILRLTGCCTGHYGGSLMEDLFVDAN